MPPKSDVKYRKGPKILSNINKRHLEHGFRQRVRVDRSEDHSTHITVFPVAPPLQSTNGPVEAWTTDNIDAPTGTNINDHTNLLHQATMPNASTIYINPTLRPDGADPLARSSISETDFLNLTTTANMSFTGTSTTIYTDDATFSSGPMREDSILSMYMTHETTVAAMNHGVNISDAVNRVVQRWPDGFEQQTTPFSFSYAIAGDEGLNAEAESSTSHRYYNVDPRTTSGSDTLYLHSPTPRTPTALPTILTLNELANQSYDGDWTPFNTPQLQTAALSIDSQFGTEMSPTAPERLVENPFSDHQIYLATPTNNSDTNYEPYFGHDIDIYPPPYPGDALGLRLMQSSGYLPASTENPVGHVPNDESTYYSQNEDVLDYF